MMMTIVAASAFGALAQGLPMLGEAAPHPAPEPAPAIPAPAPSMPVLGGSDVHNDVPPPPKYVEPVGMPLLDYPSVKGYRIASKNFKQVLDKIEEGVPCVVQGLDTAKRFKNDVPVLDAQGIAYDYIVWEGVYEAKAEGDYRFTFSNGNADMYLGVNGQGGICRPKGQETLTVNCRKGRNTVKIVAAVKNPHRRRATASIDIKYIYVPVAGVDAPRPFTPALLQHEPEEREIIKEIW